MAADTMGKGPAPMSADKDYVNPGQDDQMEILGYKKNIVKTALTWVCILLTVGLLRLFFYWLPHYMVWATHSRCSLAVADTVVMKDPYEQWFVSDIQVTTRDGARVKVLKPPPIRYQVSEGSGLSDGVEVDTDGPVEENPVLRFYNKSSLLRFFISKRIKYIWNRDTYEFTRVKGLEDNVTCSYFHQAKGLRIDEQYVRRVLYGVNSIPIHVTPIIILLFKEVLSPFYIFQIFSCSLWYADEYEYYASCIVLISVISITATIYQTRKMQRALRNTIQSSTIVTVRRKGDVYEDISSEELVPGDVIEIPKGGCIMQCDAVLVSGNCIVNESMLTGESVPITKTPLPNPKMTHDDSAVYFNMKDHSRHVLFCGTHVIQTRFYGGQKVCAVVFRTGFGTAKGELVRSILYPKPVDFKFNKDTYKFVGVLAFVAFAGLIFTIVLMQQRGDNASDIVLRSLDLLTIAVPPALPAALTVGIVFAQSRMKRKKIYCISPRSINVCGSINTVCFDKTGTLTEDGLDIQGIVPSTDGSFEEEIRDIGRLSDGFFKMGMATCHSLTIIDGILSGDPLELIMFETIKWELEEPGEESSRFDNICPTVVRQKQTQGGKAIEIGVVRQFTFSSSLQRMSVITRKLGANNFDIFTKGAPEMIASLCLPETVPLNFHETLQSYTQHGYRVLALAYKSLPDKLKYTRIQRVQREQVERNLTFLGLLVMENRLKPETTPVIDQLREANIRTIMVTGDNMLTALSVARECHMIDKMDPVILVTGYPPQTDKLGNIVEPPRLEYVYTDRVDKAASEKTKSIQGDVSLTMPDLTTGYKFVVTGKSWAVIRQYFPDAIPKICVRGKVFARMSPDQKAQLVEVLQDVGYYVGMCGDGANDCGALKTAHAGISLSEAEASVASAFTSKTPNISCIPAVISEGRAALVTSFGIFKYMACYSLTQFVSVLILYWIGVNLTDFQFLYIDLFLLTTLSISFGRTGAYHKLVKDPPLVSLISLAPVLSLILQMGIMIAVQVFFFFFIQRADWFTQYVDDPEEDYDYASYENTSVFYSSMYQYIILAVVFSKGRPYRKTIFSNYWFLGNLIICLGISVWINMYPTTGVSDFLELIPPPSLSYRAIYIGVAAINLVLCLLLESFILDSHLVSVRLQHAVDTCLPGGIPEHDSLEKEMKVNRSWPPVKTSHDGLAAIFQRMDSAYQSMTQLEHGGDDHSLLDSGSETQSLNCIDLNNDDIKKKENRFATEGPDTQVAHNGAGFYNPGFEDDEIPESKTVTKL